MLKEFKEFALKGNVLDLAVGVIIGSAFGKIVASLVNDLIMPLIGILLGGISFANLKYVVTPASEGIEEAAILYGSFIQSVIDFLIIAVCVFLFVKLLTLKKQKAQEVPLPAPGSEEILLTEIRDILKAQQN